MLRQTFRHYRILNLIAVVGTLERCVNALLLHDVSNLPLMLGSAPRGEARQTFIAGALISQHAAGTTYTCLFILVTASISGIKPGLATKPPTSPQV